MAAPKNKGAWRTPLKRTILLDAIRNGEWWRTCSLIALLSGLLEPSTCLRYFNNRTRRRLTESLDTGARVAIGTRDVVVKRMKDMVRQGLCERRGPGGNLEYRITELGLEKLRDAENKNLKSRSRSARRGHSTKDGN